MDNCLPVLKASKRREKKKGDKRQLKLAQQQVWVTAAPLQRSAELQTGIQVESRHLAEFSVSPRGAAVGQADLGG